MITIIIIIIIIITINIIIIIVSFGDQITMITKLSYETFQVCIIYIVAMVTDSDSKSMCYLVAIIYHGLAKHWCHSNSITIKVTMALLIG